MSGLAHSSGQEAASIPIQTQAADSSRPLRVLDLFSGIGGFALGLERAGFETAAFCEINPFCQAVLRKHWPEVPCYDDVRTLTAERLAEDGVGPIDVITGGFPCQDISCAGLKAGISDGTRSGLWSEIARLCSELRPSYVVVENVANLLAGPSEQPGGWFGRVLGDLAERGYDAEWEDIPAATVGAPHRRQRVWIVAYPTAQRAIPGVEGILSQRAQRELGRSARHDGVFGRDNPIVCDVDDGFPLGLGGHFAGGNSVVPQIPEMIGRAIMAARTASAVGTETQRVGVNP